MADHVRKQIRDALATLLAGLATTGSNVFRTTGRPIEESQLPALVVGVGAETITAASVHGPDVLEREVEINIACVAMANTALDDTLDAILKDVEQKLNQSGTTDLLGGILKLNDFAELSEIEIDTTGKKPVGRQVMTRRGLYFTSADDPTTAQ